MNQKPMTKGVEDGTIIRAGFSSNGFRAGSAEVNIAGLFSPEDAEDIVSLLEMTIRSVRRQMVQQEPKQ